jgi:hypothetical protein
MFTFSAVFSQSFQVGNKVEAYNSGAWYKASIVEIGSGNYQGYYYVHYEQYSQNQWIKGSNIRLIEKAAGTMANAPRNGLYTILSYGNPSNPIRIGYFGLKEGIYVYYNLGKKEIGSGNYSFDPGSKTITWKSGPFKDARWTGTFETDRRGKTHKIRLNRVTIGSNSTDAK